jgi:hypothetical protein
MTTIITYHPTKRPRKRPAKAVPAAMEGAHIVYAKKPGKARRATVEVTDDAEADERVAAFVEKMIKPR